MILQTVSINAAPRERHIKLFKVHGEEWEKLVQEIASLDAVALVSWARVFDFFRYEAPTLAVVTIEKVA